MGVKALAKKGFELGGTQNAAPAISQPSGTTKEKQLLCSNQPASTPWICWCVSGCCTFVCLVPAPTPGSRTVLATTRGREQFAIRLSSGWWCTMLRGLPCLLPTGVACCGKHRFLFAALILSRRTCSRQMVESGQLIQCKEERYVQ